jgi:DGQHR domain-containing protein
VGSAGRYQFLAEFLAGERIPGLSGIKVPATRGYFGPDKFYSFTISARHLLKIAFVNHQALNHPDSRPAYQRMINKARLQKIGKFIEDGGFFPTNILINFDQKCSFDLLSEKTLAQDTKLGMLHLPDRYKSAFIIDGQHRLFGFTNLPDKFLDRPLTVFAFEELPPLKEADLFITINHEQKSVPKSLLVALQADLKLGSDDPKEALSALASALVRSLASDATSPFFRRFAIPGVPEADAQNLTLAEAVKGLTHSTLLGRAVGRKSRVPGFLSGTTDEDTLDRARKVINAYFRVIMDADPKRWNAGRSALISVNPGLRAHLRLLNEILKHQLAKGVIDPQVASVEQINTRVAEYLEAFAAWLKKVSDEEVASKFARKFGEGGVAEYYYALCEIIAKKNAGVGGDDFKNYVARRDDERAKVADEDVNDLQLLISTVVIDILKDIYGSKELDSGDKAYWELGIENSEIKQAAYKKQQQNPPSKRAPKEAYLDLVDFEKIIKQKGNWDRLKPIFSVPLRSVNPKSKEYHIDWLNELNEVRRISAHKSQFRNYKETDYDFIAWLKKELYDRCAAAGIEVT